MLVHFRKLNGMWFRRICRECENKIHQEKYKNNQWNGRGKKSNQADYMDTYGTSYCIGRNFAMRTGRWRVG